MEYKMSVISTSPEGVEAVSNALIVCGVGGFEVCDSADFIEFLNSRKPAYDYVDESVMALANERSIIKFYTALNGQGDEIIRSVEHALGELKAKDEKNSLGTLELTVSVVDDSEWKDNWKQFYRPIAIGKKLMVVPAWEQVDTNVPILKIDPGLAFGTGSHETTALCLELLSEEDLSNKRVMDVGCGSGILSQAAVILGAGSADGCDIDEAAVTAAKANAALNGIVDKVNYYHGDLLEHTDGNYDIVVANIVADIIKELSNDVCKVLKKGGLFIASGIISERAGEVADHIGSCGFTVTEIRERRGWAAIRAEY